MWIESQGVRVYYERSGAEEKPPVLLLHGWGCHVGLYRGLIGALSPDLSVIAPDFPGHGESGRPPVPWGIHEFARVARDLMDALGIERCDILGHSHGGRTALRFAIDSPERVGRLVLFGSAGLRKKPTAGKKLRGAAFDAMRACLDGLDRTRLMGALPGKAKEAVRRRFGSADYIALDEEMRKTFVKVVQTDLTEELPKVRASTLLIWGENDAETPLWMGKLMETSIPDAGLVVLPGAGHYAYVEKAYDFHRVVRHYLLGGRA